MRLFIASELENTSFFHTLQDRIKALGPKASYPKQFHLTYAFLGEVADDKLTVIKQQISSITFSPIQTKLTSIGVFPHSSSVRVVWVGLSPSEELAALEEQIRTALPDFPRDKAFTPHITLARIKFVKDRHAFADGLTHIPFPQQDVTISSFKLIKSTLSPDGPIYEDLVVVESKHL